MPTERPVISSAKRIGLCTLVSRVTGLIRDMLLVQTFGLSWVQDAFNYAFQFPNLFRRLFGEGAVAAAFVPTFTKTIEQEGREPAWRLLARTLALLTVTLIAVILLIEAVLLAVWLWARPADPLEADARRLLLALTALMLPFMLSICVLAMFSAILNCVGSFVPAALTPLVLNFGMIAGITLLGPALSNTELDVQVFGVAISVVVAGVVQLALIVPVLRANGVRLGWRFEPRDPAVRRVLTLMAPVALGQGILVFGVFIDAQLCAVLTRVHDGPAVKHWFGGTFAYPLEEGALSAITVAQRLYQFPLGVLAVSIATAALPMFSRLAAREDWSRWSREIRSALRMTVFAGLLAGGMMIVLAEPIIRLLFEYKNFTPADTARSARVLVCYGFGMWAFCGQHIILRGFYSLGDVRTPLRISCVLIPINIATSLALLWVDSVREAAFGISTAITSSAAVLVGIWILQRRTQARIVDASLLGALARMVLIAVTSTVVVSLGRAALLRCFPEAAAPAVTWRAIDTLGSLAAGCGLYLLLAWVFRLRETRLLLHPTRAIAASEPE